MKSELKTIESAIYVVNMSNKSPMALALEHPKIRDYPKDIRTHNTFTLFKWLLDILGVKGRLHTDSHHDRAIEFIHTALDHYTYQEIKLAFEIYIKGDLVNTKGEPYMILPLLNAVIMGQVMKSYERLKQQELTTYFFKKSKQMAIEQKKELTPEEKELLMFINMLNYWEEFKNSEKVGLGGQVIFDRFVEKGILGHPSNPNYKNYYAQKMYEAKQIILEMHEQSKSKYVNVNEYKQVLRNIHSGASMAIENKAKCLVLEAYFKKIIEDGRDLQEILQKHWEHQAIS